jgi:hypothetical protein
MKDASGRIHKRGVTEPGTKSPKKPSPPTKGAGEAEPEKRLAEIIPGKSRGIHLQRIWTFGGRVCLLKDCRIGTYWKRFCTSEGALVGGGVMFQNVYLIALTAILRLEILLRDSCIAAAVWARIGKWNRFTT